MCPIYALMCNVKYIFLKKNADYTFNFTIICTTYASFIALDQLFLQNTSFFFQDASQFHKIPVLIDKIMKVIFLNCPGDEDHQLYYTTLNYTILYYTILCHYCTTYYTTLNCTVLYYTKLYYTILHYTILYYTILCYIILYFTLIYYTIPYYAILCYTILQWNEVKSTNFVTQALKTLCNQRI